MPQTLLALLALVLAALLSFTQQRATSRSYQTMVTNELELSASGTMMHAMELIAARAFDENSTPEGIDANTLLPELANQMSVYAHFGENDRGDAGCDLMRPINTPDCDDVDDLDGLRDVAVWLNLASGDSIRFDVDIDVSYVADTSLATPSAVRTLHKRVVLHARSPHLDYLPGNLLEIERVISYDPVRADAEYEAETGNPLDY